MDYDPAVCDNCGRDEHTPAELDECVESMLAPVEQCCAICGTIADDVADRGSSCPLCPDCQDAVDHYADVMDDRRHDL